MKSYRPIRIGYMLTAVWEGGLERFTHSLMTNLPKDKFHPILYCLKNENYWLDEFRKSGLEIRVFNFSNKKSIASICKNTLEIIRLIKCMRTDKLNILHTHDFFPAAVGRIASFIAGVPHRITTLHNLYSWFPRWAFLVNRILSHITDIVTCVSQSVMQFSLENDKLPIEKYQVILNGVSESTYSPRPQLRKITRDELGVDPDDILIGCIGSITTRKGHIYLIQAMPTILKMHPNVKVMIFGANHAHDQNCKDEIIDTCKRLNIQDKIKLCEPRKDVANLHSAFDIYCMPSVTEGLSLASIEAMMCEALCVFSDIGPFKEVIIENETGFLFRSRDTQNLAEVICNTINAGNENKKIRENARIKAIEYFSESLMTDKYIELYQSIVQGKIATPYSKSIDKNHTAVIST